MPTVALFHTQYWEFSDTNAAPVHIGMGGYPLWQASIVTASLFGIVGAWIDTHWLLLKWHWSLATRVHRLSKESRAVVMRTVGMLESPAYPHAQAAVRKTATTLGFTRPEAWKPLKALWYGQNGPSENIYRRLNACKLLRESSPSTITSWDQNLLIELAYHGFTITRK